MSSLSQRLKCEAKDVATLACSLPPSPLEDYPDIDGRPQVSARSRALVDLNIGNPQSPHRIVTSEGEESWTSPSTILPTNGASTPVAIAIGAAGGLIGGGAVSPRTSWSTRPYT